MTQHIQKTILAKYLRKDVRASCTTKETCDWMQDMSRAFNLLGLRDTSRLRSDASCHCKAQELHKLHVVCILPYICCAYRHTIPVTVWSQFVLVPRCVPCWPSPCFDSCFPVSCFAQSEMRQMQVICPSKAFCCQTATQQVANSNGHEPQTLCGFHW